MVMRSCLVGLLSGLMLAAAAHVAHGQSKSPSDEATKAAQEVLGSQTVASEEHARFLREAAASAQKVLDNPTAVVGERDIFLQQERVEQQSKEHEDWFREQVRKAGETTESSLAEFSKQQNLQVKKPTNGPQYLVFVSQSMGDAGLKNAFAFGRERLDVVYVFRGFAPGQDLGGLHQKIAELLERDKAKVVNIQLNPPAFIEHGITSVPSIVKLDENGKLIAKVSGVANPDWLEERIVGGDKGDLGKYGLPAGIIELDLVEEMKSRIASLNFDDEQEKAKARFFEEMEVIGLPYAKEKRRRDIFPNMTVMEDVFDHEGKIRYRKGEVISMKEHLPMAPVLVVFNSQDIYHVEFAKNIAARFPNKNVILMTTEVDRAGGFASYLQQEREIGRPVYLLTPDVKSTFGIEKVPTLVQPLSDRFAIVEVPLLQGVSEHAGNSTSTR